MNLEQEADQIRLKGGKKQQCSAHKTGAVLIYPRPWFSREYLSTEIELQRPYVYPLRQCNT